jgi:hypothetical protein
MNAAVEIKFKEWRKPLWNAEIGDRVAVTDYAGGYRSELRSIVKMTEHTITLDDGTRWVRRNGRPFGEANNFYIRETMTPVADADAFAAERERIIDERNELRLRNTVVERVAKVTRRIERADLEAIAAIVAKYETTEG